MRCKNANGSPLVKQYVDWTTKVKSTFSAASGQEIKELPGEGSGALDLACQRFFKCPGAICFLSCPGGTCGHPTSTARKSTSDNSAMIFFMVKSLLFWNAGYFSRN